MTAVDVHRHGGAADRRRRRICSDRVVVECYAECARVLGRHPRPAEGSSSSVGYLSYVDHPRHGAVPVAKQECQLVNALPRQATPGRQPCAGMSASRGAFRAALARVDRRVQSHEGSGRSAVRLRQQHALALPSEPVRRCAAEGAYQCGSRTQNRWQHSARPRADAGQARMPAPRGSAPSGLSRPSSSVADCRADRPGTRPGSGSSETESTCCYGAGSGAMSAGVDATIAFIRERSTAGRSASESLVAEAVPGLSVFGRRKG